MRKAGRVPGTKTPREFTRADIEAVIVELVQRKTTQRNPANRDVGLPGLAEWT